MIRVAAFIFGVTPEIMYYAQLCLLNGKVRFGLMVYHSCCVQY